MARRNRGSKTICLKEDWKMAVTYEDTIDTSSVDARRGDVVLQKIVDKNTLPIAGDILVGTGGSVTKGANNAYTVANVTRLAAGTAGLPLVSNGVGAMPGYQQLPGASIQTYSIDATTKLTKPVMSGLSGRVQYTLQCAYDEQDDRTDLVWNTIDGSGAIADGSIYTAQLANAAVTNAKIADLAINSAQLQLGAVNTAQIAIGAVTSEKLQGFSLTKLGSSGTDKTYTLPNAGIYLLYVTYDNPDYGVVKNTVFVVVFINQRSIYFQPLPLQQQDSVAAIPSLRCNVYANGLVAVDVVAMSGVTIMDIPFDIYRIMQF
jgi:hypothetical protein